jgi:hypothetical protein
MWRWRTSSGRCDQSQTDDWSNVRVRSYPIILRFFQTYASRPLHQEQSSINTLSSASPSTIGVCHEFAVSSPGPKDTRRAFPQDAHRVAWHTSGRWLVGFRDGLSPDPDGVRESWVVQLRCPDKLRTIESPGSSRAHHQGRGLVADLSENEVGPVHRVHPDPPGLLMKTTLSGFHLVAGF